MAARVVSLEEGDEDEDGLFLGIRPGGGQVSLGLANALFWYFARIQISLFSLLHAKNELLTYS